MASNLDLDFTAEEFGRMSNAERVALCRMLARRAEQLAANDGKRREAYLQIAKGWTALADDMALHGS